jgi:restriction system protein
MDANVFIKNDKSGLIEVHAHRQLTPTGKLSTRIVGYVKHKGLNIERKFVENDVTTLQSRLSDQAQKWKEEWDIIEKNKKANGLIEKISNILNASVGKDIIVDWKKVLDYKPFPKGKPVFKDREPRLEETQPKPHFYDKLFKSRYERILDQQELNYKNALKLWKEKKKILEDEVDAWEKEKKEFEKRQEEYNLNVEISIADYGKLKPKAVEWYLQVLLEQSEYPINFNKKSAIEYKPNEKLLVVEYFLPSLDDFPKIKETKYLKTTGEIKDIQYSERELNTMYEDVLYKVTLRTINELFRGSIPEAIESIVFNGWVNNLNKAIGKRQDVCILSIMVNRAEYMDVDFKNVDAKACFKRFKGVAAAELSILAPIPPILKISREDRRFVEQREVGQNFDDSENIAAMDWEDFEHFIRELFEREYQTIGGEVKVTQSSRDRGVDAVAFDPDPIRGGKIIIQAKRYTNTVKVESVRALYGVMQDEGAMKGILVTTSDFGPDAYAFAKDKPITLLCGGNLLSMLHKHGFKGKIDINEAKKILNE